MRRICCGLVLFFGGIVFLSAVVSPWAYWLWDSFFPGEEPFRRVFNRTLMVSALALLWPLAKYWGLRQWQDLGLGGFARLKGDFLQWFVLGMATVAGLFLLQIFSGERGWKGAWSPLRLPEFWASACAVGLFEEILFRGLMFLALFQVLKGCRTKASGVALLTSVFFATTHYLKAGNPPGEITWSSGWIAWWMMLGDFSDARMLALRWVSLLLVGLVLCALAYRKKALWACMGLHAGWVFGLKALNHATEWKGGVGNWWFQADILSGLSAEIMLGGLLIFVCWGMRERGRQTV